MTSTYGIANSNLISLLYKKYIGVVDGNPFTSAYEQALWNVRPRVIPSAQIMAIPIPATAPSLIGASNIVDASGGVSIEPIRFDKW